MEKSDSWRAPETLRVITLSTSLETPNSTYGPFRRKHDGLTWIVEGGGVTTVDDHPIRTRPGTVMLMRAGSVLRHDWGPARSFQSFVVFDLPRLPAGWPSRERWPRQQQLQSSDVFFEVWRTLLAFEHARTERSPVVAAGIDLLLRMFLTGDSGAMATTAPVLSDAVERALAFICARLHAQPDARLRLEDVARRAHVTPAHLCRMFQRELRESPMHCVQLLRVEQAAGQLERSELSLAEIAERHGYSSQFHFSRCFKQSYGLPPSEYRQQFRLGFATRPGGLMYRHHHLRRYLYERGPGRIFVQR